MKKGQVIVTDVIIALALLILTSIILIITLSYYKDKLNSDIEFNDLVQKASVITDNLAFSQGIPENWTLNTVVIPGLASWERRIVYGKLLNFSNLTSSQIKDAFHIGSYLYNFNMYYHNGTQIVGIGYNFTGKINISANSRRAVMYGNQSAYIDFNIWR